MAITKRQNQLDIAKWLDSEKAGYDTCGSYDYCEKCNKNLENPCDKAFKKANPTAKKTTAKKTTKK